MSLLNINYSSYTCKLHYNTLQYINYKLILLTLLRSSGTNIILKSSGSNTILTSSLLNNAGSAVECFVCSYAPRSNSSRIDGCTESNFTDIVIDTRTCGFGCERVASYDVNGKHWRQPIRLSFSCWTKRVVCFLNYQQR